MCDKEKAGILQSVVICPRYISGGRSRRVLSTVPLLKSHTPPPHRYKYMYINKWYFFALQAQFYASFRLGYLNGEAVVNLCWFLIRNCNYLENELKRYKTGFHSDVNVTLQMCIIMFNIIRFVCIKYFENII